jgi:predicted methyltransferase
MPIKTATLFCSALGAAVSAAASAAAPVPAAPAQMAVQQALVSPSRSPDNVARDRYRHPSETLAFFGLKPGMTVVEVWPFGGWYTEILAPALGPSGRLYVAQLASTGEMAPAIARLKSRVEREPAFVNTRFTDFGKGALQIAPAGSADMVLSFRNIHNWMGEGWAPAAFKAFYVALKPGGVLGIEEHRLPESRVQDEKGGTGYVKQSVVIAMAQAAGFRLVGTSEVNANPQDTADYPKGVWTLPPNYAEGHKDRARYTAIGESDRMTLKFVKPG